MTLGQGTEPDHTGLDMPGRRLDAYSKNGREPQKGLERGVEELTYILKDSPLAAWGLERAVGWEALPGRNQEDGIRKQTAIQVKELDVSE